MDEDVVDIEEVVIVMVVELVAIDVEEGAALVEVGFDTWYA